ncbi:hypothetical protein MNBD_CHLOROFLEXI01-2348 [hydrothermal vent metagenome]|uniref:HigA protein (Antitoxin to HigB) n=1 Tax=hydrothermal vent metagenome TaxID=652676 RepID=A0A3B0VN68_9ZZZZ
MNTISLDKALETVMQLPSEQQEMLIDIVRNRQIEQRRQEIADDAQKSLAAFQAGKLKPQSTSKLIAELHFGLDKAE